MKLTQDARCLECGGAIGIVVDDGREPGASTGESMRRQALDIVKKHGGWKCDRCDYRLVLTGELLTAIALATDDS